MARFFAFSQFKRSALPMAPRCPPADRCHRTGTGVPPLTCPRGSGLTSCSRSRTWSHPGGLSLAPLVKRDRPDQGGRAGGERRPPGCR